MIGAGNIDEGVDNLDNMIGGGAVVGPTDNSESIRKYMCKKNLLDIVTDLFSSEIVFNDKNSLHISRFQYLVNSLYNSFIEKYIAMHRLDPLDIVFLYKGGTTLKILYEKYRHVFEELQLNDFINSFEDSFKRSDSDYTIFINKKLTNYITHFLNINKLSAYLLQLCRFIINHHTNEIVPLNVINYTNLENIFAKILHQVDTYIKKNDECDKLLNIHSVIGLSINDKFYTLDNSFKLRSSDRYDSVITLDKSEQNKILIMNIDSNIKNTLYLTYNDTPENKLGNPSENMTKEGIKDSFVLHRMKVNFILYYKDNTNPSVIKSMGCPSELIDVSISKPEGTDLYFFDLYKEYECTDYVYNHNNMFNVHYKSHTIFGNIVDLIKVLFYTSSYPWSIKKSKKRIYRLIFFIVLDIMETYKNDYIKINNLIEFIINVCEINITTNKDMIISKLAQLTQISNEFLATRGFGRFFFEMNRLVNRLNSVEEMIEYNKYVGIIAGTLKKFSLSKNVNLTFNGAVPMLGGNPDYTAKYLKYKAKYMRLKQ
jgi:hypothetical protein